MRHPQLPGNAFDAPPSGGALPLRPPRAPRASLAPAIGLALGTLLACGCGGDSAGEQPQPGEVVWNTGVRTLVIASAGGGLLPTPPGSACAAGSAEHTLQVTELRLDSWSCEGTVGAPYRKVEHSRAITAAQLQELSPSLEKLQVVVESTCGADKPAITLKLTTGEGTREYRDSFYGCLPDPRPAVDSSALDEVFGRLTVLAAG